jgi:SAM-dependent methyltransferase
MYENLPLSFSQCINCNTIQLDELIPLNELYSESHNYTSQGKTWENYFDLFIKKIKPIIENKIVLEIGCPSGKIALNVNNFKEWIIVEPNKNLDILFSEKVTFIEKFFDKEFCLDYKIDIIIHSHLFEHIYDFREFLNKCYEILDDNGEMVFGIPNMQNFAETDICPFLGIFFEHTCFLNNDNISILLNESGFEIVDCIYYEKHSVLYHCKKLNNISLKKINKVTNYYDSFINTLDVYKNFVKHANNCIKNTNKEVIHFWGII